MKQCCVYVGAERCDKMGVCSIEWPEGDGTGLWYCAEHYDLLITALKQSGRIALLKGQHV